MIALIVSESKHETALLETYIQQAGYDTIVYGWGLKAMDNLEEISPALLVINAQDFPRHWKILAQYANIVLHPRIVLFVNKEFDEEEIRKATYLGIECFFTGFSQSEIEKFQNFITTQNESTLHSFEDDEVKLLFLNPNDGKICTGKGKINKENIIFHPDREIILSQGDILEDAALKTTEGIKSIQAQVANTEQTSITLTLK
ncbi:MAG: hypothetical protein J6B81_02245 [Spirochaetaceae bacterium]|nr:hypothetical protein [Spirochaetaceae bacterium]